jgi:endonuclease YncB( thermonuclease family)
MRNPGFLAAVLAVALIGVVGAVLHISAPPRVLAIAALPPLGDAPLAFGAAAAPAPDTTAVPEAQPDAAPVAPPDPAPAAAADDLPTVAIDQLPVHMVPDADPAPPPHVTLHDRDGEIMTPGRGDARTASAAVPMVRAAPAAPAAAGGIARFGGAAHVGNGAMLDVAGRPVMLFGVRLPQPSDRCDTGAAAPPRDCAAAAQSALAQRLPPGAAVTCRIPPGQSRRVPAAVCLDSTGTDLGGFLVAQGLALADSAQSYEYTSAEGAARAQKRGLWRYR